LVKLLLENYFLIFGKTFLKSLKMNHIQDARRVELGRRQAIPRNTMLTEDNTDILLTEDSLKTISNLISKETKKEMSASQVRELVQFVSRIPPSQFHNLNLRDSQKRIATQFITRIQAWDDDIREEEDVPRITKLGEITDHPTIVDYQRREIMGLTTDENPLKYAAHHNRRGDAAVDRDRVRQEHMHGDRSGPNNLLANGADTQQALAEKQLVISKHMLKAMKTINSFLNPESIDEIFLRSRQSYTTFQNVTLPHMKIPFDSRYRLISHTSTGEYKWNLHSAGFPGHFGDIRLKDTLQQAIRMEVCPFWIPAESINNGYYGKVRLLIKEFSEQALQHTSFSKDRKTIITTNYHFEFDITKRDINRFYLEPVCSTFEFRKPLAIIETITFVFYMPFERMDFEPDRGIFDVTHSNPAVFTLTDAASHNLATGDLVYIEKFDSVNTAVNDLINRKDGYIITRLSNTQFSIPVDLTAVAGGPTEDACVYYGSKRILATLEFISLEQ